MRFAVAVLRIAVFLVAAFFTLAPFFAALVRLDGASFFAARPFFDAGVFFTVARFVAGPDTALARTCLRAEACVDAFFAVAREPPALAFGLSALERAAAAAARWRGDVAALRAEVFFDAAGFMAILAGWWAQPPFAAMRQPQ